MKKFFIMAKTPQRGEELREHAESMGFEWDEEDPDFIISLGGDGTYLMAERQCPGIPKLLARDSMVCFKCFEEPIEEVLVKVNQGKFMIMDNIKLEAVFKHHKMTATNDVIVRTKDPTRGLRFKLRVNGEHVDDEIIGDGVVVATPFGSTGYYHAITRKAFIKGIGIAFSNPVHEKPPMTVSDDDIIEIEIIRGEGQLASDNNPQIINLKEGDVVTVQKSPELAKVVSHTE